ncbi:MAG TPA: hypothetical protein VFY04_00950 [Solirubrobacterales bacterium]|nr:hypothetical protein [Solirubrobacterales bacterium]
MRALDYPYGIPSSSYALVDGEAVAIESAKVDLAERVALLAYGSNASPEVLSRKLAAAPDPVPVRRTTLRDFDVVYSAHVSPYGAIPATLARSPGTEVNAFVAFLTSEQLELVSATEPNYDLARFDRPSCTLEKGAAPAELNVYLSKHGALLIDGHEVALAEIEAEDRRFREMTQPQIQQWVRDAGGLDRGEAP